MASRATILLVGMALMGCTTLQPQPSDRLLQRAQVEFGNRPVQLLLPLALRSSQTDPTITTEAQRMQFAFAFIAGYRAALEGVSAPGDAAGEAGYAHARKGPALTLGDFGYQHLRVRGELRWDPTGVHFYELREDTPWDIVLRPGVRDALHRERRGAETLRCTLEGLLGPEPTQPSWLRAAPPRRLVILRIVSASPTLR